MFTFFRLFSVLFYLSCACLCVLLCVLLYLLTVLWLYDYDNNISLPFRSVLFVFFVRFYISILLNFVQSVWARFGVSRFEKRMPWTEGWVEGNPHFYFLCSSIRYIIFRLLHHHRLLSREKSRVSFWTIQYPSAFIWEKVIIMWFKSNKYTMFDGVTESLESIGR